MIQSSNGQPLPRPERAPQPKRHNAKLCPFIDRQRIVAALANGDSIRAIARALHHSPNTVTAVAQQEWKRVEARKGRLAAQAERAATLAADRINAKLESSEDIPLNVLVPVFGVAVDKTLSLRGDSLATIRHLHDWVDLTQDDLIAFAVARSEKRAQAAVVEVPALPGAEQAPSANTRNRNPRKH